MRPLILFFFLLTCTCAQAQKAALRVAPKALFGFEPLANRYVPHHLAPIATYITEWRKEIPNLPLFLSDSLLDPATKFYLNHVDTTLYDRILTHLNASIDTSYQKIQDSTLYTFPPSRQFLSAFDPDIQKIRRFFATPIAIFDTAKTFDPYAPSPLSQTMHSFQLEASGAELSLWAPARMDAKLEKELYAKDIFYMLRHTNQLVVITLSGKEIKELLEKIYAKRFYTLRSTQSDLLNIHLPPSMHQSIAGINYKINLTKRKIEAATDLNPKKQYNVVMSSYAASKIGKPYREIGDYNTLLINYISRNKEPKNPEQWSLSPERWVGEIKAREALFFRAK